MRNVRPPAVTQPPIAACALSAEVSGFELIAYFTARFREAPAHLFAADYWREYFVGGLLPIRWSNRLHAQFRRQIVTRPRGNDIDDYSTRSASPARLNLSGSLAGATTSTAE